MSITIAGQIDIAGPVGKLVHRRPLKNGTVMQGFGIDPVTDDIYVAQIMEGGIQLSGESAPVDYPTRKTNGDLCLTRLGPTREVTGHMYLRGFGHGVSIGVENRGGAVWIWSETASSPNRDNDGYGTHITSFPFRSGQTIDYGTSAHTKPFQPDPACRGITPTIDRSANELVVRYNLNGVMTFERYDLAKATAGVWERLQRLQPPVPAEGTDFQGYASHDGVLYTLKGQTLEDVPLPGDTYIAAFEWATGALLDHQHITAGPGLEWREAEGMAVSVRGGVPHLHFGFACENPGPRTCTIMSLSAAPEIDTVKVLADWTPIALAPGVTADQNAPAGRLISMAGVTILQLRGGVRGSFDADAVIGTLPDTLSPSMPCRANVPRNNTGGLSVARVEAGTDRQLRLFGGRSTQVITWAQLDSFHAVWR